jgi:hypothetical protein
MHFSHIYIYIYIKDFASQVKSRVIIVEEFIPFWSENFVPMIKSVQNTLMFHLEINLDYSNLFWPVSTNTSRYNILD